MPRSKSSDGQRGRSGNFRSISSFERRLGRRPPRQCILIVCEGAQTEPNYFESLRRELKLTLVEVKVEGHGAAPISVVDRALVRKEERKHEAKNAQRKSQFSPPPFDGVWCVFDVEKPDKNPSFQQAVSKARSKNLELAVSNPAFEYWYLLHFKETSQPFADATELIRALKDKDCLPNYEKSLDVCAILFTYTEMAVERANRLLANHPDIGSDFPNPSTLVYKLVKKLIGMARL